MKVSSLNCITTGTTLRIEYIRRVYILFLLLSECDNVPIENTQGRRR